MRNRVQHIQYFLFSQYLADGVRVTLEILLPAFIGSVFFGRLDIGLMMSTGALCVSISDSPGPVEHKRNGMLWCTGFVFVMALLTGFLNRNDVSMGLLILLSTFLFTMISVYGQRAAAIGTAVLLMMILRMDHVESPALVWQHSLIILSGGIWYMTVALIFFGLTPYRPAQRLLGNCLHETANFLRIKSELYDVNTNIEAEYRNLVEQQVVVNERQSELRELLYKNIELLKESTTTGKLLVLTFADTIDLYEQIMATWYDYHSLRNRFGETGILDDVAILIRNIADELDEIGLAIQSNGTYKKSFDQLAALDQLKQKIDALADANSSNLVLKKILVNIRSLGEKVDAISKYFDAASAGKSSLRSNTYYEKFVSHQDINFDVFKNNLTLESGVFRHALRMMITCMIGFVIATLMSYGHHSYWILLTIIVILKPGFALSKQRNLQRLIGTITGGLIGIVILLFVKDHRALFVFILFFMIGTYTFQRVNYIVMVIFMTPYILILFSLLGMGFLSVIEERIFDTAIASLLAFFASYLLFPHWESRQLDGLITSALKANILYLQQLRSYFCGEQNSVLDYKLLRKDLYTSTANLSAAFQRMSSEPKSKQTNAEAIYEFVVLNHVLSANVASITASVNRKEMPVYSKEILQPIRKSIELLENSLLQIDPGYEPVILLMEQATVTTRVSEPDTELTNQLAFVQKVTTDIAKLTSQIKTALQPKHMATLANVAYK